MTGNPRWLLQGARDRHGVPRVPGMDNADYEAAKAAGSGAQQKPSNRRRRPNKAAKEPDAAPAASVPERVSTDSPAAQMTRLKLADAAQAAPAPESALQPAEKQARALRKTLTACEALTKATGDEIVAGLWRNRLVQELCWHRYSTDVDVATAVQGIRYETWVAPSWSWAATKVAVHPGPMRHHMGCVGMKELVEVVGVDVRAQGTGRLDHAVLQLRGRIVHARFNLFEVVEV